MPAGFALIVAAQFVSALADHALLIVAMALLHSQALPAWWAPLLKFSFTLAYVLLAPGVGAFADAWPKARVMAWMNALKAAAVVALLAGAPLPLAFALVGLGAAAYAPAKYGLVTELVPPALLVRANAWIESSVVFAVLLGTVLGGALVSSEWTSLVAVQRVNAAAATIGWLPGSGLAASVGVLLALYLIASALNLGIPDSGARYRRSAVGAVALWSDFLQAQRTLRHDRDGGLSLAVTSLFWGAGATLQIVVLHWAMQVHGLGLDRAAGLQAVVAVGVIAGAAWAGRVIGLSQARRVLPLGVGLGLVVLVGAFAPGPLSALPLLALVGAFGGALVVPMNALLQHRGCTLLPAGQSIAVQGFFENASVLLMLGLYALLLRLSLGPAEVMAGLGLLLGLAMAALMRRFNCSSAPGAAPAAAAPRASRRA
jgi:MFS family permease